MTTIKISIPSQDPLNEMYRYRPTGCPDWDHVDPILFDTDPQDDPHPPEPGWAERGIRLGRPGLFELLESIESQPEGE